MKRKLIGGILILAMLVISVLLAFGQDGPDGKKGRWEGGGGHDRGIGMPLRGLDLSDDQRAKVKELAEASRTSVRPVIEGLKANREKLEALTANGAFDEAQVTAVANEQGALTAKLIVEKERIRSQVFALLNDEQKAKLSEMKARHDERRKASRAKAAEKVSE